MDIKKVDTKGLDCPIPLIELKKALSESEKGQIIELEFTCPHATVSLPHHCEKEKHEVLSFDKIDNKAWKIVVKK